MQEQQQQIEAQQVLDELMGGGQLPFKLVAYQVQGNDRGQYVIHFHDSRIHLCRFSWNAWEPFKDAVRTAVLDRVNRLSGPLR